MTARQLTLPAWLCSSPNTGNFYVVMETDPAKGAVLLKNLVQGTQFWTVNQFVEELLAKGFRTECRGCQRSSQCNYPSRMNVSSTQLNVP
jgi:hypothetical protein